MFKMWRLSCLLVLCLSELSDARGRLAASIASIMSFFEAYDVVGTRLKPRDELKELEGHLSRLMLDFLELLFYRGRVDQLAEDISKGFKPSREEVICLNREVFKVCERAEERVSGAWRALKLVLGVQGVGAHSELEEG